MPAITYDQNSEIDINEAASMKPLLRLLMAKTLKIIIMIIVLP